MSIGTLILIVVVIVVGAYVINQMLSLAEPLKMIFNVILALCVIAFVLQVTGLLGSLDSIRVGR